MKQPPNNASERAVAWRAWCEKSPEVFASFGAAPATRRRLERGEAEFIETLCSATAALDAKAVAFRSLMELRGCPARKVEAFFAIEPDVVIAAITLLRVVAPQRPNHDKAVTQPIPASAAASWTEPVSEKR